MNPIAESFVAVLKALHEHEVEYVLIGGLAVSFHDIARVTKDIDIFVKRTPENFAKLRQALRAVFADEAIAEITHEELEKYPVLRYGTPANYYIDVLDRIGEAFSYEDLKYEVIMSPGFPVRVATMDTLIKLKEGTLRPRDHMDVAYLIEKMQEKKKNAGL
ncbi:MAG: nucleotidyl transferase AbiEii/AbiGii toxin family protein [candidate division KSB1 bacterium]